MIRPNYVKLAAPLLVFGLALAASGCSEPEVVLEGTRSDSRAPVSEIMATITAEEEEAFRRERTAKDPGFFERLSAGAGNLVPNWLSGGDRQRIIRRGIRPETPIPLQISAATENANWTHINGGPEHKTAHLALDPNFKLAWKAQIGGGNERRNRISADPIVVGGRVFAMDSRSRLTSLSMSGKRIWSVSLVPQGEHSADASGGGLAFGGGLIFATTGYGYLHALNPNNGKQYWSQFFGIAPYSAPTVIGSRVIAVTQDSKAWAIDIRNGRFQWTAFGAEVPASLAGGASPAAWRGNAIIPMPSGELASVNSDSGSTNWSTVVAGRSKIQARSTIKGVTGDPVVDGEVIYAGNQTGATSAFAAASGNLIWTHNEGSYGPVWPEGNSVFLVSDSSRLNRLNASNGRIIWSTPLPRYKTNRVSKQAAVYAHFGPILAGGRLIVPSSDGNIRSVDPVTGEIVRIVSIDSGAASNPVVANGMLFIVNQDGELLAYK
ncbi:MAG: PQQ-binding-like beta-propeller repeat protein [Albidovulum sp.]|nr:PQQ-binding-like beta-propeller repeat protein [Albidovulum sp.]